MISVRLAMVAMVIVITLSNLLVMCPINDWLTWGAFPYPISFFITELVNRVYGTRVARLVVSMGFCTSAVLSFSLATPLIAMGSLTAFYVSQHLDICVFNKLRKKSWWQAPFYASLIASFIDTAVFWTIAFWGQDVPLYSWIAGDFAVKVILDIGLLTPFRMALNHQITRTANGN